MLLRLIKAKLELFYINGYGMEMHPSPNPEFLSNLASKDILVYSCGSLWTRCGTNFTCFTPVRIENLYSIMPCLALKGVAAAIARSSSLRVKVLLCEYSCDQSVRQFTILLVNAENDRETMGYTAADYIG